jgi:glycosyltransferase involved in cell wall biosynthesis
MSWSAASRDFVILFCAKLQPWKRPLDLLRAFAKLGAGNALLVFAGDGPLRKELETESRLLGIPSRVRFLGFVNQSQLPGVYTAADVMVLPSAYEPFAVVVNEAMLCGCAVVASDRVGAARDLINPGKTGFVFPCGDVEALARILAETISEPVRLREIGRAARHRLESWSPREHVESTIEAVATAVSRLHRGKAPTTAADR